MSTLDWQPIFLTLRLAVMTTSILIILGWPLAFWLGMSRFRFKWLIEPFISLPLVLPPTVLGFYLLIALGPHSGLGRFLQDHGYEVIFSFTGLIIGSVIFSLPFMINPIKAAVQQFPVTLIETAATLGKTPRQIALQVILPNIQSSLWTGIIMTFAHTLGEFGVVLMIGGNIPGVTRTASIAVFSELEALNYHNAHIYSIILVVISFVLVLTAQWIGNKKNVTR